MSMVRQPPLFLLPDQKKIMIAVFWCGDCYEARINSGWYSGRGYPADDTIRARKQARGRAIKAALKALEREFLSVEIRVQV